MRVLFMTNGRQMNFRKLISAAFIAFAAIACKKNDEGTVSPSLEGYLSIKGLSEFVSPDSYLDLEAEGVTNPGGGEVGYYWKLSPTKPEACTTKVYRAEFSDTLQTCTVYCNAFAEGYSGTSLTSYVTVVKGGKDGSIKGIDFPDDCVPTNDGEYYYRQIGSQTWTMNNLAERDYGKAYRNAEIMSDVLGRYYNYEDAKQACESLSTAEQTWALPTLEDWRTLESYVNGTLTSNNDAGRSLAAALMADATFNSNTMWKYRPKVGDITNSSGFSAIPAGYANLASSAFEGVYEYATFWTDTEAERADEAYCAYLYFEDSGLYFLSADKESFGASVRCIQK